MRYRLGLMCLIVVGAAIVHAQDAPRPDPLTGVYRCEGTNGDGSRYEGFVQVVADGDRYALQWEIARSRYPGIAIRQGDTLAVLYDAGGSAGLAVYRLERMEAGGVRWVGRWVLPGAPGAGTEIWTPMPAAPGAVTPL